MKKINGGGGKRKFKDCIEEDLKMTDAETDFCGKRRSPVTVKREVSYSMKQNGAGGTSNFNMKSYLAQRQLQG